MTGEHSMRQLSGALGLIVLVVGCASAGARTKTAAAPAAASAPAAAAAATQEAGIGPQYPSTYQRHPNPPVLIRNATIMTAAGQEIQGGSILFKDGRIVAVGTNVQALPVSANLIGGRSAVLKLVPARSVQEMKFPGAHYGLKMACGENPKRTYGGRGGAPSTRMGNMAGYRAAFIAAQDYRRRWDKWNKDHQGDPPERNLRNESLAE